MKEKVNRFYKMRPQYALSASITGLTLQEVVVIASMLNALQNGLIVTHIAPSVEVIKSVGLSFTVGDAVNVLLNLICLWTKKLMNTFSRRKVRIVLFVSDPFSLH